MGGWAAALTAGTALILRLVDEFSAVTAITVTTLRKAGTLAASFALFPKPLGLGHPIGAALVLCSAFVKAGIGCRCRREGVPSSSSAEGELDDLLPKQCPSRTTAMLAAVAQPGAGARPSSADECY